MSSVDVASVIVLPTSLLWLQLVFSYLSVSDLFCFRAVSRDTLALVNEHFRRMIRLDLSSVRHRFSWVHFRLLIKDNVSLRHLNLVNALWIEEIEFDQILSRLSRLASVDLSHSYNITNDTVFTMALHCQLIEKLTLRHCSWLSCDAFLRVVDRCERLSEIDVTSCWNLNDNCVEALFQKRGCTLRRVVLACLYSLSDQSTSAVATMATSLLYLDLSSCWRMTDRGIQNIIKNDTLQQIILSGCSQISLVGRRLLTDNGIEVVARTGR